MKTADKAIKSIGLSLIDLLSFSHIYVTACLLIEVQALSETYNSLEGKKQSHPAVSVKRLSDNYPVFPTTMRIIDSRISLNHA